MKNNLLNLLIAAIFCCFSVQNVYADIVGPAAAGTYTCDGDGNVTVNVEVTYTSTTQEWLDCVSFTFPAGWMYVSSSLTSGGADLSVAGTNVAAFGNAGSCPAGDSDLGPMGGSPDNFTFIMTPDAAFSTGTCFVPGDGDAIPFTWTYAGDGYGNLGAASPGVNAGDPTTQTDLPDDGSTVPPDPCEGGTLVNAGPLDVCPGETFDFAVTGEIIPTGGSYTVGFSDALGGTGGLAGGFTIGNIALPFNLDAGVNGILAANGLADLVGTWELTGIAVDANGSTCTPTTAGMVVNFLDPADPNTGNVCNIVTDCIAGTLNTPGPVDACPGDVIDFGPTGTIIPTSGAFEIGFDDSAGGTGGLVGGLTLTGVTPPYTFDEDLNGVLSGNVLPVFAGTWLVTGYVTDASGNRCDSTAVLSVNFLDAADAACAGCVTNGGTLSTTSATTVCALDGNPDVIDAVAGGDQIGDNFGWLITDGATGNILSMGVMASGSATFSPDLEGAPIGTCNIYVISWNGTLTGADQGSNISGITSDECFALSAAPIAVMREDCSCVVDAGEVSASGGTVTTYNRAVIANRASGTISVINSDDNTIEGTYPMPSGGQPMYVVYNSSNNTVLVGDYNGSVAAFDGTTFAPAGSATAGNGVFHMWLSPDNQQLWVNNELDNTISVINPNTLATITTFPIPSDLLAISYKPHDVIVSPDNSAAFVTMLGGAGGYVIKYSTTTFTETARAFVGDDPHVSLTPANDKLYVASQGSGELAVLNRSDLSVVTILNIPNAHGLGMNQAGTFLYVGNISGGETYTVDLATNTLVGSPVSAPFAAPHNYSVTGGDSQLFLTHSGATNDKVSIYTLSPTPTLVTSLTVGNNPFGLVTYSYTEIAVCALDGNPDVIDAVAGGDQVGDNFGWLITDGATGNILSMGVMASGSATFSPDLEGAPIGTCNIYVISWNGTLTGADQGSNISGITSDECFALSAAPIAVMREDCTCTVDGGTLSTTSATTVCALDGNPDVIDAVAGGDQMGDNFGWLITDAATGNILSPGVAAPGSATFSPDLEGAPVGTCNIYVISWNGTLTGADQGSNISGITSDECFALSTAPIAVMREDCANPVGLDLADPCNCLLGIDLDGDFVNDLAQETITITPGTPPYTTVATGLVNALGTPLASTAVDALIAAADPGTGAAFDITAYVPADGVSTYTLSIGDQAGQSATIEGGPCTVCEQTAIPTASEWGLIVLALLLLSLGVVYIRQTQTSMATTNGFNLPVGDGVRMPFERHLYIKALLWTGVIACVAAICSIVFYGEITLTDIIGSILAAPVFTYLMHILMIDEAAEK